jgi:hypothetical protein
LEGDTASLRRTQLLGRGYSFLLEDTDSWKRIELPLGGHSFLEEDTTSFWRTLIFRRGYSLLQEDLELSGETCRYRFLKENIVPVKDDNIILFAHIILIENHLLINFPNI